MFLQILAILRIVQMHLQIVAMICRTWQYQRRLASQAAGINLIGTTSQADYGFDIKGKEGEEGIPRTCRPSRREGARRCCWRPRWPIVCLHQQAAAPSSPPSRATVVSCSPLCRAATREGGWIGIHLLRPPSHCWRSNRPRWVELGRSRCAVTRSAVAWGA